VRAKGIFFAEARAKSLVTFDVLFNIPLSTLNFYLGTKEDYKKEIANASLEKLAHLFKICGFLKQTKVYLFWK
jgi:hypothetical protein